MALLYSSVFKTARALLEFERKSDIGERRLRVPRLRFFLAAPAYVLAVSLPVRSLLKSSKVKRPVRLA